MAKPSGVKITFAIDQLAEWFGKEIGGTVVVSYWACSSEDPNEYRLYMPYRDCEDFSSFSAMRRWMEGEIKRRRVLFRRF